ncbi:Protein of unknown function [Gryllus bimaculatus]|nr:Protein of unknown function [Gryllus bimaculatus]
MLAATRCLPGRGPRMLECGRALADGTHSAAGAQRACTGKTSAPQPTLTSSAFVFPEAGGGESADARHPHYAASDALSLDLRRPSKLQDS